MNALLCRLLAIFAILTGLGTAVCAAAPGSPEGSFAQDSSPDPSANELLAAHNRYRAEVGVQPLRWSSALAADAQRWARYLASVAHRLQHSGMPGTGENLAMCTSGYRSSAQLVDLWAAEKFYFTAGIFPDVSRLGDWKPIAHYTQMIWRHTTEVGCGTANDGWNTYLVCRYSPQGNVMAQSVY